MTAALLGAYFAVLTLVTGWSSTLQQFSDFRFHIVPLKFNAITPRPRAVELRISRPGEADRRTFRRELE